MIRPLKFEFRNLATHVRSRQWSLQVDEVHCRPFGLRLVCPAVVPSIEISDGSDDENSAGPREAEEPAWDSPESFHRKLSVELFKCDEGPLWAVAMVSTAEKSPREHCVTLAGRDYGAARTTDGGPPDSAELLKVTEAIDMCGMRGSFTVDVLLQVREAHSRFYTPRFHLISSMLESFADGRGEGTDFTFVVDGGHVEAHSFVLKLHGEVLRDWCQQGSSAGTAPQGVSKVGLITFLRTLYGESVSPTLPSEVKKQVVMAAHWCGVHYIRMTAETSLLNNCLMTDDNVLEWYHFAKHHMCPLLQQQAERYFFFRANAMKHSNHASLRGEDPETILELTAKMSQVLAEGGEALSIDELRQEVNNLGGDVDGDEGLLRKELRKRAASRKRNRQSSS